MDLREETVHMPQGSRKSQASHTGVREKGKGQESAWEFLMRRGEFQTAQCAAGSCPEPLGLTVWDVREIQ